jgi:LmbE family N-acetylglucosaminyl deacetylase
MAVQAHSDDIPLTSGGTVAKLVKEGYLPVGELALALHKD